jgi:hypothetical protein
MWRAEGGPVKYGKHFEVQGGRTGRLIPESCTKYRSEAQKAAVDSWCKIQVIGVRDQRPGPLISQIW